MLNNMTWKKIMTGALAFTLVSGVALPVLSNQAPIVQAAETTAATGITPFTDVPAGLYAEKHIYRLSLQQIVKGYENKTTGEFTFKYNNTISQEEAVIMALRFAGLESKVNSGQMVFFQEDFYVKEDYKPYIELAFEEGLLNREEEYAIAAADPETKWGSKSATREWVTKLIINAIGAQQKALELASKASSFEDKAEIDNKYLGYVNAAVELGLVKGVTDTKFAPKSPINRASFATILSRAQKDYPIKVKGQHYGVITELSDTAITIYENGFERSYSIDKSTGFYSSDSDFAVEKTKFGLYTDIALIEINGQAKLVETLGSTQYVDESIAPVLFVNTTEQVIYVRIDDNPVAIPYNNDVIIQDSKGKKIAVTDLKEKNNIKVIRDTFRTTPKVIAIELLSEEQAVTTTITGTYFAYDSVNNLITIKTDKGPVSKFAIKSPTINVPYVKNATIKNLISNADTVTLTMNEKDEVVDISVPATDFKVMYLPAIIDYDAKKDQITVHDATGYKAETLFFTDSTRYLLDGILVDSKFVSDPLERKALLLRYVEVNGKKQIVYFDMLSELEVEVVSVDYFDNEIELKLPDGTITTMDYSTQATIESLSKPKSTLLDIKEGMSLMVDLSQQERSITSFRLPEAHLMTISSISTATQSISFKLDNQTYSVLYDEVQFVDSKGKQVAFSQLKTNRDMIVSFYGNRIVRAVLQ